MHFLKNMLEKIMNKQNYQPQTTVEKFNQMMEWSKLSGHSQAYPENEPLIIGELEVWGINIDEGVQHGVGYRRPANIGLYTEYYQGFIFLIIQDEAICYYESHIDNEFDEGLDEDGPRIRKYHEIISDKNLIHDKEKIKSIDEVVDFFYTNLDMANHLETLRQEQKTKKAKSTEKIAVSRKNKITFLEKYLDSDDEAFFETNFLTEDEGIYDVVMWIDWKEFEENIISYCQNILQDDNLQSEIDKDIKEERGIDIYIHYKGVKTKIEYEEDKTSRDKTLIALNEAIKQDYEIRFCNESDGDTLAFVPLTNAQWASLEKKYPDAIDEKFTKIDKDAVFFDC